MWPNDTVKTAFGLGLMFIQFFIPAIVLIICYGKIVWVLTKRINSNLIKHKSEGENSDKDKDPSANTSNKARDTGKDKFQLARQKKHNQNFTHCWTVFHYLLVTKSDHLFHVQLRL